jgi:hypothetical protein
MTVYIGRPGSLAALRSPLKGVRARVHRPGRLKETLGGGRAADYAPRVLREWQMNWAALPHDDQAALLAYFAGHNGPGPYAFLDGAERNLLTPNQSAATSVYNDTSGFTAAGTGETLASSTALYERGPRSLAWSLPASVTGGILTLDGPVADWYGIPCVPGQTYRLQARVRGGGTDGVVDITAKLRWLDAACVKAATTCPAGAVYLQPRFDVTAATVTATGTVYLDKLMVSMPTTLDPGTTWAAGLGVARVTLPQMEHALRSIDAHSATLTVSEVA